MRRIIRKRRGMFRIIEILLAVAALFAAFTTAVFMTSTSRINVLQEHSDLDRVGQNILLGLAESGVIDSTVKQSNGIPVLEGADRSLLANTITKSLPPLTYFSLTIYYKDPFSTEKIPIFDQELSSVTNAEPNAFQKTSEVSSSSFMYTSPSGTVYYLVLTLARAG